MKKLIIISFLFSFYNSNCQVDKKYCGTDFYPSPDNKKVIIVDRAFGEIGCYGYTSRLYKLPLDCNNYISLDLFNNITWDYSSTKIITTEIKNGFADGDTYVNTALIIHDSVGIETNEIKYAASPAFNWNDMYFCREYDSIKNVNIPMLFKYNLITKEEKLLFEFDTIYSFWNEQIDFINLPKIEYRENPWPKGIIGVLYNKNDFTSIALTFQN